MRRFRLSSRHAFPIWRRLSAWLAFPPRGLYRGRLLRRREGGNGARRNGLYRLLFLCQIPGTPLPANPADYSAFAARIATDAALDLTQPDLNRDETAWTDLTNYEPCQALAEQARLAKVEAILYRSVRDPAAGLNIAILSPKAFAEKAPVERMSWRIRLSKTGVQALCEFPMRRTGFAVSDFAGDPRLASLLG